MKSLAKAVVLGHHNGNALGSVHLLTGLIGGEWKVEPDGNGWHWEKAEDIATATNGVLPIEGVRALELARKGHFPLLAPSQSGEIAENYRILWAEVKQRTNDCNIDEIIVVRCSCNLPGLLAPSAYSITTTEVWRNISVDFSTGGACLVGDKISLAKENK